MGSVISQLLTQESNYTNGKVRLRPKIKREPIYGTGAWSSSMQKDQLNGNYNLGKDKLKHTKEHQYMEKWVKTGLWEPVCRMTGPNGSQCLHETTRIWQHLRGSNCIVDRIADQLCKEAGTTRMWNRMGYWDYALNVARVAKERSQAMVWQWSSPMNSTELTEEAFLQGRYHVGINNGEYI